MRRPEPLQVFPFRLIRWPSRDQSWANDINGSNYRKGVFSMSKLDMVRSFNDSAPQAAAIQTVTELQQVAELATLKLDRSIDRLIEIESQTLYIRRELMAALETLRSQAAVFALRSQQTSQQNEAVLDEIREMRQGFQAMREEAQQNTEQMNRMADMVQRIMICQNTHSKILDRVQIALPKTVSKDGRSYQPRLPPESMVTEVLDLLQGRRGRLMRWVTKALNR